MDFHWLLSLYFPTLFSILNIGTIAYVFTKYSWIVCKRPRPIAISPNQVMWSKSRSVQLAQFRIYGLCFLLTGILFSTFSALNFWSGMFPFPTSPAVEGGRTMLAYLKLSVGTVLPLFFCLQVVLKQKVETRTFRSCLLTAQPFLHLLLFVSVSLLSIPWIEGLKAIVGQSNLNSEGVAFFLGMAAAYSILPVLGLFTLNVVKSPAVRYSFINVSQSDLDQAQQLLQSNSFDVATLEHKADSELEFLIKVAKYGDNMEQAVSISQYLLARHLVIEKPA